YVDAEVGLIVYMPDDQYVGLDSFAYSVCDSGPDPILCDTAMVFLEISDRSGMEAATVQKGLIGNLPFNPETLKNSKTQALPETRRYLLQQLSKQGNLRPGRYSFKLEDDGNILTITPVGTR
ncbi:MAG: hypothetical protein KDC53_12885, partial [Saprospiraceae bacterium]|nr:hypothetical protein [Saprospiraceae bacterium]